MARLTTVGGSFAARVLQARLEDEGLTVELRGNVDSPYAFTVGAMSTVDVFVPEHDLEDAKLVMLVTEVDSVLDLPPQRDRPVDPWGDRALWLVLVAIALLGIIPIVHMATSS
jgi:Putative prokaryotic signal transducing protein